MKAFTVHHEMILASAGSGKTFQLSERFIQLMRLEVAPDAIVALTFSRKAAGEMFEAIIHRLLTAAEELPSTPRVGSMNSKEALTLLKRLLGHMHQLTVTTFDSFCLRLLHAFSFEFQLSTDFRIFNGQLGQRDKERLYQALFSVSQDATQAFLQSFKKATLGQEEKRLDQVLDTFVTQYHSRYLELQDPRLWGNPLCIWSGDEDWLSEKIMEGDMQSSLTILKSLINKATELTDKQREKWMTFLGELERGIPYPTLPEGIRYLLPKLCAILPDIKKEDAWITVYKPQHLGREWCQCLHPLLLNLIRQIIELNCYRTQGLYQVLQAYEAVYHRQFRQQGKLRFLDLSYLLSQQFRQEPDLDTVKALTIEYRLGNRYKHWLLDEFQDTSTAQWLAIENLIDEVLQDSSGESSFFCVGDLKQAIHGWRGGNARLMESLIQRYNQDEERIQIRSLNRSWRSVPAIIDCINQTFTKLDQQKRLPTAVIQRWQKHWQVHHSQRSDFPGYAILIEMLKNERQTNQKIDTIDSILIGLLKKIQPIKRGLSCAILVRKNDTGRQLVNRLRHMLPEIPCSWEGSVAMGDSPIVNTFLSLIKLAEHPGDTFAWQHLKMSPFGYWIQANKMDLQSLSLSLLEDIHYHGFDYLIQKWACRLQQRLRFDRLIQKRINDLRRVAHSMDHHQVKHCLEFIESVRNDSRSEQQLSHTVQVMTMHKAKGLGFDLVILPDLQDFDILRARKTGLAVHYEEDQHLLQPQWALILPYHEIARADPILNRYLQNHDNHYCYEALCLLYVAMTRAKQGLYMLVESSSYSSRQMTWTQFLMTQLTSTASEKDKPDVSLNTNYLYQSGDPKWYRQYSL